MSTWQSKFTCAYAIRIVAPNFSFYLQLCYSNNEKRIIIFRIATLWNLRWLYHFSILVFNSGKKEGKIRRRRRNSIQQQRYSIAYIAYIQNTYFYLSRWKGLTTAMQISAFEIFNSVLKFFHWNSHGKLAPKAKDPSFSSFYRRKFSAKYTANTFTVSDREWCKSRYYLSCIYLKINYLMWDYICVICTYDWVHKASNSIHNGMNRIPKRI